METNINMIQNTRLLKSLSKEVIKKHLNLGEFVIKSYKKDNILHFEGEKCSKLEIILDGEVVVEQINESGSLLHVSRFISDDILGGNILYSSNPYFPLTVSTTVTTTILSVEKDTLTNLLNKDLELLLTYLSFVSDHTSVLGDKIKSYVDKTIRESIVNFLTYESKKQKSNVVNLNISKKALAAKMGVQRTSLSRELAKMRDEGLIIFDAKTITILPALENFKNVEFD